MTYSKFRLQMDTGTRVWVLGFLDAEDMTSWGKSLAEKCGKGANALKDVKKLEPGQEGDAQPVTFMLSLVVLDGAGPGSMLEVQDPYGRKIRITVPEDLGDDRKMSVCYEALKLMIKPQVWNQNVCVDVGSRMLAPAVCVVVL